ncbi:MAG: 50S ribosomal protein L21 [Patescibacteria group bacterium]|nr:50S ribosomal protein L21 [Patescibacteria group bacterium]
MTQSESKESGVSNGAKFAIIETGGKQYLVEPKEKIQVEKLVEKASGVVSFDKVLLVADGKDVKVGKPYVDGAVVSGKILRQAREKKVIVFKYHNKTRYRRKKGHRQHFTEVEITKV